MYCDTIVWCVWLAWYISYCIQSPANLSYPILTDWLISGRILLDIPCKVCRDHSSGKHYGIFACDGLVFVSLSRFVKSIINLISNYWSVVDKRPFVRGCAEELAALIIMQMTKFGKVCILWSLYKEQTVCSYNGHDFHLRLCLHSICSSIRPISFKLRSDVWLMLNVKAFCELMPEPWLSPFSVSLSRSLYAINADPDRNGTHPDTCFAVKSSPHFIYCFWLNGDSLYYLHLTQLNQFR